MLVVLASIFDTQAAAGVAHWRAKGATAEVITCHDLAQPGWTLSLDDAPPTLVIAGKPVAAKALKGVVTRISQVTVHELPFIRDEDREYAASEMQAFLLALLTGLPCPVLNAARPGSLNGPAWSAEQWARCAVKAGIAVQPVVRRAYAGGATVTEPAAGDRRVISVVGDATFGDASAAAKKLAGALAKAAGVDLLRVVLDVSAPAPVFVAADTWLDLSDIAIADAVRTRLA